MALYYKETVSTNEDPRLFVHTLWLSNIGKFG